MIQKIILTGGAGVGKTTIINLLKSKGYGTLGESGREVYISEQNKEKEDKNYKPKLPQTDYIPFEEKVIQRQLDKEGELTEEIYFLDKSLVDCLGMSFYQRKTLKSNISELIRQANYFHKVFLLSPLENYENDEQRRETEEEMIKMHKELQKAYISQGFDVIEVPIMSPEERVDFILRKLNQKSS